MTMRSLYRARRNRISVGVGANVVVALVFARIGVMVDSSSNVVDFGLGSSFVANFNVGARLHVELLVGGPQRR